MQPVQYVKICSLYGVGFYYIPGTDMCLKMGGWVRAEYAYGDNGNMTWGPYNANANNRGTSNSTFRACGYITADARNQTAYGTVRSYIAVGLSTSNIGLDSASNTFNANRAFIQWAGFTFGIAQSFFDFYSVPATAYWGAYPASDTGDPGWMVMGYTAQFGNGWSATIAAEQRRITQIIGPTAVGGVVAPVQTFPGDYGGFQSPDVVANLRVDQAWGSAQIMGALHQVNALYYDGASVDLGPVSAAAGNPSDTWGFAVGGGLKVNTPFIGKGDYFQSQVTYAQGASRYVFFTPNTNWAKVDGNTISLGLLSDGVYGGTLGTTATSVELTTSWGVNAAYEHFWNMQWRTSVYGGYAAVSYDSRANAMLCQGEGLGAGTGTAAVAVAGCDNNWNTWWVGSRTQWNVTSDFYMGVDVLYQKMNSLSTPTGLAPTTITGSSCQLGSCRVDDIDNWMVRFRVHKDFYP
ncbi:MAG TPA: porin [Pseudolabrys sp.]|nr:porin [Pseudolabrys sp.]